MRRVYFDPQHIEPKGYATLFIYRLEAAVWRRFVFNGAWALGEQDWT